MASGKMGTKKDREPKPTGPVKVPGANSMLFMPMTWLARLNNGPPELP